LIEAPFKDKMMLDALPALPSNLTCCAGWNPQAAILQKPTATIPAPMLTIDTDPRIKS
jgi:hypothetical protein